MFKTGTTLIKNILSILLVLLLVLSAPMAVLADNNNQSTGPQSPPGADSSTYTYNSNTGLWENDYYTWDPVTQQTAPKTPQAYSYNPDTGRWDTTEWVYDAAAQKYVPNVVSKNIPPGSSAGSDTNVNNTGPDSSTTVDTSTKNSGYFNNFYDASISNRITTSAHSGGASILNNTTAGDASSGGALDVINIINTLQSSWFQPSSNLMTFTANINGNVVGDLYLDPTQINNTGAGSLNVVNSTTQNNLTVNNQGSGLIDNNIILDAGSGNATVDNNTAAGNATSGKADAVANIVNVLNSAISAGQSFLGVININGNLDGDILLPPSFLDQLIASGAPSAVINTSQMVNNNVVANSNGSQTIDNNVDLAASSGQATVDNNTSAGNAKSGNGSTNLTIFNLTGRQVIAKNSLMVFVNVLGKWVGLIMNAPSGNTTAAFCGGTCNATTNVDNNALINDSSTNTIRNNLKARARSGDTSVNNNMRAGDATSGDASASANLLNINESQLSLSDWFGVLFINVMGSWHGSFGVNTEAGNRPPMSSASSGDVPTAAKVFAFVPGGTHSNFGSLFGSTGQDNNSSKGAASSVLGAIQKPVLPATIARHVKGIHLVGPIVTSVVVLSLFGAAGAVEYGERLRISLLSYRLNRN